MGASVTNLRKHHHNNKIIYTYLITLTIILAIVSPRVVTQFDDGSICLSLGKK